MAQAPRNPTRAVQIGSLTIGAGNPIAIQSMCATKTADIDTTVAQIEHLVQAGADIIRLAVDTKADALALAEIRQRIKANLSCDLQENYRLAADIAPVVDKIRYNPGHLFHHEQTKPWQDKVKFLADVAGENNCAIRVGVNCGSIDPAQREKYPKEDRINPMLDSALEHCELLDKLGFTRYVVSLKNSDPAAVVEANRAFAARRPDVPLHLGVTEAGMPPEGVLKTQRAFEQLISAGIGDTIRVSLTVPAFEKKQEILAGRKILNDIAAGRFVGMQAEGSQGLDIISCPSCSRVENSAFVDLAVKVHEATRYAASHAISIAVMGCRVNGPGETDMVDLGLWCGPNYVNLKRGEVTLGSFTYEEILPRLKQELDALIVERNRCPLGTRK
ncbi:MAG: flavodoxin/ferredoxin-dependent (E)-4-hydroxy-3-methylbut-2-enyl-diphosphate synthase [Planctomycetota bacterium]